ncbi:hypothetical protein GRI58_10335 [Porphyrobacter algicida]|uniref:Uncharacterized protein n=1 Tax=Qipengyuania algicida TaxID=1836209 RepID=A0A845AQM1_9SPHN|nr:hypothetical protein [Qipengyuania algicida]MXP29218.1 hypothetical protein [Qipengyuania algicida]
MGYRARKRMKLTGREGLIGHMIGRRMTLALIALFCLLVFAAWFSGGERPMRMIEQSVAVPGGAR